MLILHTGDRPIERISDASHEKHNQRFVESPVYQQPNVAGNEENTEDGQAVGDIHIIWNTEAHHGGRK